MELYYTKHGTLLTVKTLYAMIIEDISKRKRQNSGWLHSPQVNELVRASLEASKQVTKEFIPIFYHAF